MFGSYLLHATANPAHFYSNWAGLAVLCSRQSSERIPGFFFLFRFNILIVTYFLKYKTIETHACTFLPPNISAVDSVSLEEIDRTKAKD